MTFIGFRGQAGINIIIILALIVLIAVFLQLTVIQPRNEQSNKLGLILEGRTVLDSFCNALNYIGYSGNGVSSIINLPGKIATINVYNLSVYNTSATLYFNNMTLTCQIRAKNITFYNNYPPFTINKTNLKLDNVFGGVKIS